MKTSNYRSNFFGHQPRVIRALGKAGVVGAIFFLAVFLSLHWLNPSIDVARNYVSEYAIGPYGWIFQLSWLVHGFGNLAIAAGLFLIASSPIGKAGATLFGLAAMGVLITGTFSTDPLESARTTEGTIHAVTAFAAFPIEAMALLLLAVAFKRQPSLDVLALPTIGAAFLSIASLLWFLLAIASDLGPGLAERASFMTFMGWEILAGLCLARDATA
jgi:hypothetical membrane protein